MTRITSPPAGGTAGDRVPRAAPARPIGQRILPNEALAAASVALALAALLAVARGRSEWGLVPPLVWLHLGSILAATLLTPLMLLRARGTRPHRLLGRVWIGAMLAAAASSLFFKSGAAAGTHGVFTGDLSPIHLLSLFTLVQVPRIYVYARRHNRIGHESAVRGMVIGALLIAGFFTFPFDRLLGHWLLGALPG